MLLGQAALKQLEASFINRLHSWSSAFKCFHISLFLSVLTRESPHCSDCIFKEGKLTASP